jgi:hypothetical protein
MSVISTNLNMSEYVVLSQLKKKMKSYLVDLGCDNFKQSNFSKGLVITLVILLEELLSDSVKHVVKNDIDGLYRINPLIINTVLNESIKYGFLLKHLKSYSKTIKYHDSVFFNIKKVFDNLESKYGEKLMVEPESKNILSYIILSVQYDLVNLSVTMVKYSKKRTLSVNPLNHAIKFLVHDDIYAKIDIKLDSMDQKVVEVEVEEDEEDEEKVIVEADSDDCDSDEESA